MPQTIACSGCGATLGAPDGSVGKMLTCPKCGALSLVPIQLGQPERPQLSPSSYNSAEPTTIPTATLAPPATPGASPARSAAERTPRRSGKRTVVLLAALFAGSLLCCFGITWYTASESGARRERERIADELRKDFAIGIKKALGDREGERIAEDLKKNYAEVLQKAWRDAFAGQGKQVKHNEKIIELSHEKAAEVEKMKIELVSGASGKLNFVKLGGGEQKSEKEYMQIKFKITNETDNFVFEYRSREFAQLDLSGPSVDFKDEFGNEYRPYRDLLFSSHQIEGAAKGVLVRVDPGQSIVDIVAFDLPIPKAQEFSLGVQSEVIGRKGTRIVYKVPRDWFKGKPAITKGKETEKGKDHDHDEVGPHNGPIAEWGEIYHAEFTVDHPTKTVTVYILDDKVKGTPKVDVGKITDVKLTVVGSKPLIQIELKHDPKSSADKGYAFTGTHDYFVKPADFKGNISGKVDKPHSGDFEYKASKKTASLYLTPGGIYTAADINANGNVTGAGKRGREFSLGVQSKGDGRKGTSIDYKLPRAWFK